ncbi:MAG: GGDEF domain-containing protein [Tumebacillaceae bacterium]
MADAHRLYMKGYTICCYAVFALLFLLNRDPIDRHVWVVIVTMAGISALFEMRSLVLPSGEELTLVTPLLFTTGVIYGNFAVLCTCLLMALVLVAYRPKNVAVVLFNCVMYGLAANCALQIYQWVGGAIGGTLHLENSLPYLSFALVYFVANVVLVSSYLAIRNQSSVMETIISLLDKQSVLIYFIMMAFGLMITIMMQAEGLTGVVIFSLVLVGLGASFRRYYEMYDHFRSLSIKDELTGLFNHRYFQETLQKMMGEKQQVSLLLLDLDHFKVYNDKFGHPQGDELLRELSRLLMQHVPASCVPCRYGGEEFAVILPGMAAHEAYVIAEQVRARIASHPFKGMEQMPRGCITVSAGLSAYPEMAENKEQLICRADQALYQVKYSTRNRVELYTAAAMEAGENLVRTCN